MNLHPCPACHGSRVVGASSGTGVGPAIEGEECDYCWGSGSVRFWLRFGGKGRTVVRYSVPHRCWPNDRGRDHWIVEYVTLPEVHVDARRLAMQATVTDRCLAHFQDEPCPTCASYIAAGL